MYSNAALLAGLPSGWNALGCSTDSASARALTAYNTDLGSATTLSACINVCAGKGYSYAGLQYGSQSVLHIALPIEMPISY